MKNLAVLFVFLFITGFSVAQTESLSPLSFSKMQVDWDSWQSKQSMLKSSLKSSIDSTFVFFFDTLDLPIFDDFTFNRFQNYSTINHGSPEVTEEVFYKLYDETQSSLLHDTTKLMLSTTYRIQVDTMTGGVFTYDSIPLPSLFVFINDLSEYPVIGSVEEVWPRYMIYDTLYISGDLADTSWIQPDVEQDSARVFLALISDTNVVWIDNSAYHNYHYAYDPMSIGVATFDGTDAGGMPYNFANPLSYGVADVLTSKQIDLSPYTVNDSVFLSFAYQAGGWGEIPDIEDSLILEFFVPAQDQWVRVWTSPFVEDSLWRKAHIHLNLAPFFVEGFQFRFRNFATLSGSFDHWHIDYVHLREQSFLADTILNDVALMYPGTGFIKPYISAPWKHYKDYPSFFMNSFIEGHVINNSDEDKLANFGWFGIEYQGAEDFQYTDPTNPIGNYNPYTKYLYPFEFSAAGYEFDTSVSDSSAVFDVRIAFGTSTDDSFKENDTGVFRQDFLNYYAYDDATAEAAYGLNGIGAKLAYKFIMPQDDTLLGALMYFSPSAQDMSNTIFLLTVWDDDSGKPGAVLYQDDFFTANQVRYTGANNGFDFYSFGNDLQLEVGDVFYIGWEQIDADRLNIGFDKNNNNQDKIFFNVNGIWNNTAFEGSLLMRPVIKSNIDYLLGTQEVNGDEITVKADVQVFPNPAKDRINIDWSGVESMHDWKIDLFSISGKLLLSSTSVEYLDVSHFDNGFYLLVFTDEKRGDVITKKIVID